MRKEKKEEIKKTKPKIIADKSVKINEVFLMELSGNLVLRVTPTPLYPNQRIDAETINNIIKILQDFIKDSLSRKAGDLSSIGYGRWKIAVERIRNIYCVVMYLGEEPYGLRDDVKNAINEIFNVYGNNFFREKTSLGGAKGIIWKRLIDKHNI
ncbi:MAG: hypothetical protein AB1779_09200 [Candidatus Thermoplasmatota archaeon]